MVEVVSPQTECSVGFGKAILVQQNSGLSPVSSARQCSPISEAAERSDSISKDDSSLDQIAKERIHQGHQSCLSGIARSEVGLERTHSVVVCEVTQRPPFQQPYPNNQSFPLQASLPEVFSIVGNRSVIIAVFKTSGKTVSDNDMLIMVTGSLTFSEQALSFKDPDRR